MKKNIGAMILTGSILLSLTACSNYEPLISSDGITSGSAVSGNSVTSVVSGGAVENKVKNNQKKRKENQTFQWAKRYRNCNSNMMYIMRYMEKDELYHLVQVYTDGKGPERVLGTTADEVLWVTDEWIYILDGNMICRIPLRSGEDQKETPDTVNAEWIILDILYDATYGWSGFYAMDDNDIYYMNEEEKIINYHIADGSKREVNSSVDAGKMTPGDYCYVTDRNVFVVSEHSLYCIHRDTLEAEKIDSCGRHDDYGNDFVYMKESGELYFTHSTDSNYYVRHDTELYVYDGNTTQCVVSSKEINDLLSKRWNMNKKSESVFTSFDLFIYNQKIYIEYAMGDDDTFNGYGMLVYDRNGRLYEEEKLEGQVKKHFDKKDNYYYEVYVVQDDMIYLGKDGEKASVYSYNMKTGEMKKTSMRRKDALVPYRWCAHSRTEFGEELRGGYGG